MNLPFPLNFAPAGVPLPGLKPTFKAWKLLSTGAPLPPPTIFDHGDGQYVYYWDADAYGDARGVVDWGSLFLDEVRYTFALATKESSRIIAGIAKV